MGHFATYQRRLTASQAAPSPPVVTLHTSLSGSPYLSSTVPPVLHLARKIRPTITASAFLFRINASRTGTPLGDLLFSIYTQSGSLPGTLLSQTAVMPAASLPSSLGFVDMVFAETPLTINVIYWLSLAVPLADASNYASFSAVSTGVSPIRGLATSPDGVTWTAVSDARCWQCLVRGYAS